MSAPDARIEPDPPVRKNPCHADATATLAMILDYSGRAGESIGLMKTAMRVSPVYPAWYLRILGMSYGLTGRYDEALAIYERYRELASGYESSYPYFLDGAHLCRIEPRDGSAMTQALRLNPRITLEGFAKSQPYKNPAGPRPGLSVAPERRGLR